MDVYTAARRVGQVFRIDGDPVPAGQHGVVGDGFSCALVGVDGSINWLCLPRFDSPSVFGALLDRERGGFCRIAPAGAECSSVQAYDTDTNVLQTLFRREGAGVVCLTDLMPWNGDPREAIHELHRFLEARECPSRGTSRRPLGSKIRGWRSCLRWRKPCRETPSTPSP